MADGGNASQRRIRYQPSRTLAAFHKSKARVRGVRGPIGSGKSVGCVMELWRIAHNQAPDHTGKRRTRMAVVRNTYGELKSTTIKTWQEWIPEDVCPIVQDSPIRGIMRVPHPDGRTTVEMEVLFLALDKPKDVKKLLSLELTAAWINEAREIPWAIVLALRSRLGRYPRKQEEGVGITQISLLLDTNPPDSDHWWYAVAEDKRKPGGSDDDPPDPEIANRANFEFLSQPPALLLVGEHYLPNPRAENVKNHNEGYGYWLNNVAAALPEWIKVYLLGQYGFVVDGKPVYPEYRDDFHCREVGKPSEALPLLLGWDFGLTPALIVAQLSMRGTLTVFDEFCANGMGLEQFCEDVVLPQLAVRYPQWPISTHTLSGADPAGNDPGQADELSCFMVLKGLGFQIGNAPGMTNAFNPRRSAVAHFLTRVDNGRPAFLLSPRCRVTRKGFQGGYNLRRMQVPGKEIHRDEPDKDAFSHPHDALQYLCMLARGGVRHIQQPEEAAAALAMRRRRRSTIMVS